MVAASLTHTLMRARRTHRPVPIGPACARRMPQDIDAWKRELLNTEQLKTMTLDQLLPPA